MLDRLHHTIAAAGIPIYGVSGEQSAVSVNFRPEATQQQQSDAAAIVVSFDWSQAAHDAWLEDQKPERKAIRQRAAAAIQENNAFLAIANPTNAQLRDQLRNVTTNQNAIIRRLVQID